MVFLRLQPLTIFIVVFLTIGLGSTMISRMILNLRAWNHSEEENDEMHGMVDLAARRTGGGRPGKSSDGFTRFHTRQESSDRGVSVWIDRPQRQPRLWGGAGPSNPACDRGVSMHTEVVTIVDSPYPFVSIDTMREPTPPFERTITVPLIPPSHDYEPLGNCKPHSPLPTPHSQPASPPMQAPY